LIRLLSSPLPQALGVHVAVELGMQAADRFNLCCQGILAQKPALLRQRNPKFPDIAEGLAVDWIDW
jgi:hypothetical protein